MVSASTCPYDFRDVGEDGIEIGIPESGIPTVPEVQESDWDTGRVYDKIPQRRQLLGGRFSRMIVWMLAISGFLAVTLSLAIGLTGRSTSSSSSLSDFDDGPSSTFAPDNDSMAPTEAPQEPNDTEPSVDEATSVPDDNESSADQATSEPDHEPTAVPDADAATRAPDDTSDPNENTDDEILDPPQSVVTSLEEGHLLNLGEYVVSPSGEFRVGLTLEGRFVMQDAQMNLIWSAGISNAYRCYMQTGGNLVIRDRDMDAIWTSQTSGNPGARLVVDDGGLVAVMSGTTPLWIDGMPRGVYDENNTSVNDLQFPVRGMFYYPWYPNTWTVNGQYAKFEPDLGFYSSSDQHVAETHVDALDYAHTDLSIASWWGPETHLDRARLTMLMDETVRQQSPLKWTIYHEDERDLSPSVEQISEDLEYLKKWFAWHPAWAHVDGRPVIFVYNRSDCDVAERWMEASKGEWYVVLKLFPKYLDCPIQPDHWHQYGVNSGDPLQYEDYSFSLAPGFWRADEGAPSTPRVDETRWCNNVEEMAASGEPWQLIISFNEAGEGTMVEASSSWASNTSYGYYLDCLNKFPTLSLP